MSDALVSGSNAAGPKLAAVWQPTPVLKALTNQRFVRVQDAKGQTSHFTRSTYQHLERVLGDVAKAGVQPAGQAQAVDDPTSTATHAEQAPAELNQEAVEAIRKEAYASGLADGRQQQLAEREAQKQASEAEQRELAAEQTHHLLQQIHQAIVGLHDQPDELYEPIKRLALHLAEQFVLAELSLSPSVIQGLVQRSLDTLELPASAQVAVDLNPDDLALLQGALNDENRPPWQLQADPSLLPGSVRVSADDAMVSDLVENRLAAIAASLLRKPQRAQAQSAFRPQNMQLRQASAEVQEVLPKSAYERFQAPAQTAPQALAAVPAQSSVEPAHELQAVAPVEPDVMIAEGPLSQAPMDEPPEARPSAAYEFPLSQADLNLGLQAADPEPAQAPEEKPHDD